MNAVFEIGNAVYAVVATFATVAFLPFANAEGGLKSVPFDLDSGEVAARSEPTGCPAFEIAPPRVNGGAVINAEDFGFSGTNEMNGAAIQAALAEAKRVGAAKVVLKSGTYRCFDSQVESHAKFSARREETLKWFREHQFGVTPIGRPADEKIGERSVSFQKSGIKIDITCVLPDGASAEKPAFTEWIDRDAEITHDADDLLRLIAPCCLYVASGSEDAWAGPAAEKAAWDAAHDAWREFGLEANMGYHCHEGPHKLTPYDWEKFLDFADARMKK